MIMFSFDPKRGHNKGFFFQFCQVDGVLIIDKGNEPNLDRGQTIK